jgi:hypothetical protein
MSVLIIVSIISVIYFAVSFLPTDEQPEYISTTGKHAKLYLQSNQFDDIIIEIDYINGREPNNESLNELVSFLENICDKDQIQYVWSDPIIPDNYDVKKEYSNDDLRNLERKYRDYFNDDNSIIIYIQYLNGNFSNEEDDSIVIARTYSPSSFAVSIDAINYETESEALYFRENYTLHHEVGHLLGLVNFGYESVHPHEDNTNPGHCKTEDCIMRKGKKISPGYKFCDNCMDDLGKLKSNIY